MSDRFVEAKTMHVTDPKLAQVRVSTCPERDVILDIEGESRELTLRQAEELVVALREAVADKRGNALQHALQQSLLHFLRLTDDTGLLVTGEMRRARAHARKLLAGELP